MVSAGTRRSASVARSADTTRSRSSVSAKPGGTGARNPSGVDADTRTCGCARRPASTSRRRAAAAAFSLTGTGSATPAPNLSGAGSSPRRGRHHVDGGLLRGRRAAGTALVEGLEVGLPVRAALRPGVGLRQPAGARGADLLVAELAVGAGDVAQPVPVRLAVPGLRLLLGEPAVEG